jgi:hypothetical protein
MWGNQHTLTCGRSSAARGLGLGRKGAGRRGICSGDSIGAILIIAIAQTAKAVAVARGRFVQACGSQILAMRSGMALAEAAGFVESAFAPGSVELPLLHPVAHPAEAHVQALDRFCLVESLAVPAAALLPVSSGVGLGMARFLQRCSG